MKHAQRRENPFSMPQQAPRRMAHGAKFIDKICPQPSRHEHKQLFI